MRTLAWQAGAGIGIRAEAVHAPGAALAGREQLELALARARFSLAVDDDLSEFHRRFKRDRLLGPAIRRWPHLRPRRAATPWEAFALAVVGQLIEAGRAGAIARRMAGRWGERGPGGLRDFPGPEKIASRAPAELESLDLAHGRSVALRRVAAKVAAGRIDPGDPCHDARLLAVPGVGPWTVQKLGFLGRGELDSLPAGDLAYLKLAGRMLGLGRRAEVAEVEELFEPYRPFRGLAGVYALAAARLPAGV